jgi:transposase InsO family protein
VFQVGLMCSTLEVSRAGFYSWLGRGDSRRAREDQRLTALIREEHAKSRETYGAPRIHAALKKRGEICGLHRVERLMQAAGIRSKMRRKFKKTTDSNHSHPVAPNVLDQNFEVGVPNRVWVSDITYIWTEEGWLYLASTLDLYSRKVVGWAMSSCIDAQLVVDALQMAIEQRSPPPGLVHHSDRGVQYAAHAFQGLIEENGITCSMSGKGNCYDNAVKESFFHTLKTELCDHEHYLTRAQARSSVFEFIEGFYNRTRLHSTLGYCSPCEFEAQRHAV